MALLRDSIRGLVRTAHDEWRRTETTVADPEGGTPAACAAPRDPTPTRPTRVVTWQDLMQIENETADLTQVRTELRLLSAGAGPGRRRLEPIPGLLPDEDLPRRPRRGSSGRPAA